jgi:hypothetical protein
MARVEHDQRPVRAAGAVDARQGAGRGRIGRGEIDGDAAFAAAAPPPGVAMPSSADKKAMRNPTFLSGAGGAAGSSKNSPAGRCR